MRSKVVRTLALVFVLSGVSIVLGQQQSAEYPGAKGKKAVPSPLKQGKEVGSPGSAPKQEAPPEKSKLEEMLAEALKNNPDIRVAAAKLAEADAELNRTRLQVTQKVVTLHAALASQKAEVAILQTQYERLKKLSEQGSIDSRRVDEAQQKLTLAKAKLDELEVQMPALLGKSAHAEADDMAQRASLLLALRAIAQRPDEVEQNKYWHSTEMANPHRATGPMADKIRAALNCNISLVCAERSVSEVAKTLSESTGLVVRFLADRRSPVKETVSIDCQNIPLAAVLQLLGDSLPGYSILVRDYGLLIAPREDVPSGAISVQQFLRQKATEQDRKESLREHSLNAGLPWDPPEKIEGSIERIDPDGSVHLNLNSVDGLMFGHALHLYRPADEPSKIKYLGTIRITKYAPNRPDRGIGMVAQPLGRLSESPKVGDKVSVRPPAGVKFPAKKSFNPFDAEKNPPEENVEGLVKSADASGLMTLTIGSDAGLAKGHTLELFRLNPSAPTQAKYLGRVRILESEAHQSVAQPINRLSAPPQRGDRVASRIQEK